MSVLEADYLSSRITYKLRVQNRWQDYILMSTNTSNTSNPSSVLYLGDIVLVQRPRKGHEVKMDYTRAKSSYSLDSFKSLSVKDDNESNTRRVAPKPKVSLDNLPLEVLLQI